MPYIVNSGELYHHGVKGQKWGVRRYQNADGSLTNEGRKRQHSNSATKSKPFLKLLSSMRNEIKDGKIFIGMLTGSQALQRDIAITQQHVNMFNQFQMMGFM